MDTSDFVNGCEIAIYAMTRSVGNGRKPTSAPPQPGCWRGAPLSGPQAMRRALTEVPAARETFPKLAATWKQIG